MRALILLPLALLIACKGEASFDERYDAVEQKIRDKADAIDAELESRAKKAKPDVGESGTPPKSD
jgi:hypothetical protein